MINHQMPYRGKPSEEVCMWNATFRNKVGEIHSGPNIEFPAWPTSNDFIRESWRELTKRASQLLGLGMEKNWKCLSLRAISRTEVASWRDLKLTVGNPSILEGTWSGIPRHTTDAFDFKLSGNFWTREIWEQTAEEILSGNVAWSDSRKM